MISKIVRMLLLSLGFLIVSNARADSLHVAINKRDVESVKLLIKQGADINNLGRNGIEGSALHLAVRSNQQEIAQLLIDLGAVVDMRDYNDYTPLHNAAWNGNLDMVKLLLKAGADLNATNYAGHTPLSSARGNNQTEVVEFIEARLQHASN